MPYFHLISWYENFAIRHSFRIVLDDSHETLRKVCLSTKFRTTKLGEVTEIYVVKASEPCISSAHQDILPIPKFLSRL